MQILSESLQLIFMMPVILQDLKRKANALYLFELWNGLSYRLKMIEYQQFCVI